MLGFTEVFVTPVHIKARGPSECLLRVRRIADGEVNETILPASRERVAGWYSTRWRKEPAVAFPEFTAHDLYFLCEGLHPDEASNIYVEETEADLSLLEVDDYMNQFDED